jgi:PPM family protein phosphatase
MVSSARLRCAAESDTGRMRSNNEDRVHCDPQRGIFLVVDGIGGHAAGEKAADVALSMIRNRLERQTGSAAERIREAITVANNEILRLARSNPEWSGMACVLTVALVEGDSVSIGHVGDSRLYKIRGSRIEKITHDHSPVGEREDNQDLSEADAMRHPRRNEVYRDVGSEEHTPDDPDFIESIRIPFEPDSALLLCSDGLSDQVTSAEILRIVSQDGEDPQSAVRRLIAAANGAGGKDNVSVALVEGPAFSCTVKDRPRTLSYLVLGLVAGAALLAALQYRFGFLDSPRPTVVVAPHRVLAVGAQFTTINDALSQAHPGDILDVAAGEYREQIRLREGVQIRSRAPLAAILRAAPESSGPAVIAEKLHSARITGFRILADEKMPLAVGILLDRSDVEVSDCEIAGATIGVEIRSGRPALRANSVQESVQFALVISGDAAPWISHNAIVRNGRKTKKAVVVVTDPARPVLIGNTFDVNAARAISLPAGMDGGAISKFNFFLTGPRVMP